MLFNAVINSCCALTFSSSIYIILCTLKIWSFKYFSSISIHCSNILQYLSCRFRCPCSVSLRLEMIFLLFSTKVDFIPDVMDPTFRFFPVKWLSLSYFPLFPLDSRVVSQASYSYAVGYFLKQHYVQMLHN